MLAFWQRRWPIACSFGPIFIARGGDRAVIFEPEDALLYIQPTQLSRCRVGGDQNVRDRLAEWEDLAP